MAGEGNDKADNDREERKEERLHAGS